MSEWVQRTWGEVITLQRGYDITKSAQVLDGSIPVISSGGVSSHHDHPMSSGPGVVIGRKGTLGRVHYSAGPFWPHDTTLWVQDFKGNDPRFVYYALQTIDSSFMNVGSASPTLNRNHIHPLMVRWPLEIADQQAIVEVLGALDDRIAANDLLVSKAAALASAFYEKALAAGEKRSSLSEIALFHNRKRVPLSSRDREARRGVVPYYGAAGQLDYVDEALFDRELVLVGEDGSVVRDDGRPVVQYIWGPAWVNNHAHVLSGVEVSTELLRWAIERESVARIVTGAVQPKISMGNLKALMVSLPRDLSVVEPVVQGLAALVRARSEENKRLATTRDELLPLLMSGKLRVREAEKVVQKAL